MGIIVIPEDGPAARQKDESHPVQKREHMDAEPAPYDGAAEIRMVKPRPVHV
jgi:hypothetical protein